jgi:outer membrane protein TolC
MTRVHALTALTVVGLMVPAAGFPQEPFSRPLSLNDVVQLALEHYPALQASRAKARAADENVGAARTAYLPRLDLLWQANYGTHNNVFGLLLPQAIVPPISGPVLGTRSYEGVWGSAAGALLSWEAIDFGQRKAAVGVARAQGAVASAQETQTALDVAGAAADAFLGVLVSDAAVRAARANVERLDVLATSVRTLVTNQLRPGADASRADAELAIARNQLSQATQNAALSRAALGEAIGSAGAPVEPIPTSLSSLPDVSDAAGFDLRAHPAARAQSAAIDVVRAREQLLQRSYVPHVSVQSAFARRGSEAEVPGQPPLGNAFSLQVPNWAVGGSVTFSALDLFSVRARKRVEEANEQAARASYEQTIQTLITQETRARTLMTAALEIAANTPVEQRAAADAESRARVRYENGLASIIEVAEAERLLAQAEVDDAVARLSVWRALLARAQIRGDLKPFLDQALTH